MARTPPARAVTLSDVARLAGVSVATASKALNGRDQVKDSTRQRVVDAAEQLSFVPNPIARSLLAGRTSTVGLLTSDLEGRFVIPILMGAEDAFGAGQVNVFLCDARGDTIREQHHLKALLTRRVDGLIVVGRQTDPRPSLGHDIPVPVVYAYAPSDDPSDLSITPDNVLAGRMAVEHLVACGRTRIAHITGEHAYAAARDRADGVARRAARAPASTSSATSCTASGPSAGGATRPRCSSPSTRTSTPCSAAPTRSPAARSTPRATCSRTVPDDVAVMGFDNWEVLTTNARPELTSIDANLQHLGRTAAQRVFAALDSGEVGSGTEYVAGRLVIRGSTVARR